MYYNEISQVQKNRKITFDQKRKNIRNKEQYEETTQQRFENLSVVAERNFFLFIKLKFWKTVIEQANTRYRNISQNNDLIYRQSHIMASI